MRNIDNTWNGLIAAAKICYLNLIQDFMHIGQDNIYIFLHTEKKEGTITVSMGNHFEKHCRFYSSKTEG